MIEYAVKWLSRIVESQNQCISVENAKQMFSIKWCTSKVLNYSDKPLSVEASKSVKFVKLQLKTYSDGLSGILSLANKV